MAQRPDQFTLNMSHPLATGLVFAGLGALPGSTRYHDSGIYKRNASFAGSLAASAWSFSPALQRSGVTFNGLSLSVDWQSVDITGVATTSTSHSISMWVVATAATTSSYLADFQTGRIILGWGSDTAGQIGLYDGTWRNFGATPSLNVPHHLAFVCNATTAKTRLYVDGVQLGSELTYSAKALGGTARIGSRYASAATYSFPGTIFDFLVHERAISDGEIVTLASSMSDAMLGGLINYPRRKWWPVVAAAPPASTARNLVLGGGVL